MLNLKFYFGSNALLFSSIETFLWALKGIRSVHDSVNASNP